MLQTEKNVLLPPRLDPEITAWESISLPMNHKDMRGTSRVYYVQLSLYIAFLVAARLHTCLAIEMPTDVSSLVITECQWILVWVYTTKGSSSCKGYDNNVVQYWLKVNLNWVFFRIYLETQKNTLFDQSINIFINNNIFKLYKILKKKIFLDFIH